MSKKIKVSIEPGDVENHDLHEDIAIEPTPVSLKEIAERKKKGPKNTQACFACLHRLDHSITEHDDKRLYALKEIIEKFKNKISIDEYYKLISEWQYKLCVKPFENISECPPEWPPEMVKIHYEQHTSDYKTQLDHDLIMVNTMLEEQSEALFNFHPFQKVNIADHIAIESFRKTIKLKRETILALVSVKKIS
jgi:hypothetical protein